MLDPKRPIREASIAWKSLKRQIPDWQHPPQLLSYLGERNIAVFSTDTDFTRLQDAQARRSD